MFKGWTEKFAAITNAGMMYFNTKKKDNKLKPRKFYPLLDFNVIEVEEKVIILY